ncbi:MAG: hypothetical protein RLZZ65_1669 [Bacteroidota bacterium]|jgi:hypothetical protein
MKLILPILLLCLSFFASNQAKAQFVLNVTVNNTSSPTSCDGSASLDSNNIIFTTINWYLNGTLIQNGGTSINNLCPGSYMVNAMGGGLTLASPFTIGSGTTNPCAGLGVTLTSTPASSQTTCDGSLSALVYGGAAPYTYAWNIGGTMTTSIVNNLCIGTYAVTITDAMGCSTTGNGTVFYDTSTVSPCLGFSPVVTVTNVSAPGACDGAVSITCPTCAPFWVTWSQGSNTNSITNLCEGTYMAIVNDANGCTFSTSQFVTYNGSGNIDSITVVGTLATGANITGTLTSGWIYNCDIDMTMLDTAYMVSATFGNNPANQDSLYTVWYLADTTGAYTYINYTYYVPNAVGVYNMVLSVYCPIKSTPLYYQFISQFDVLTAAINTQQIAQLGLYPNPSANNIHLTGLSTEQNYSITNLSGQVLVQGKTQDQINITNLPAGTYLLQVNQQVLRFVKSAQ